MQETLICVECGDSAIHQGIVPPSGWMKFEEGWICAKHDLGMQPILDELKLVVERLESGGASLEESLALYERGRELTAMGQARLRNAEARVEILTPDGVVKPFR